MENQYENLLNPEEDLKASTELLRLKLELEHDMVISDTSALDPEIENKWLNNIYNFEQQYRERKRTKVYNMIGKPPFPKWDTLDKKQLSIELLRLLAVMEERHIVLDCCVEYDDAIIYKFITEELFEYEMDDIFIDGMIQHFIYEEFHPNHDYDLRRHTIDFIKTLLSKNWNEKYDIYSLAKIVRLGDKDLSQLTVASMIIAFQEAHSSFEIGSIQIKNATFDLEKNMATVVADIAYVAYGSEIKYRSFIGQGIFDFSYHKEYTGWDICGIDFPGFEN
jgi:hypothetical protein